jgi:aryl-alcohol dehydrogenase
MMMSGGSHMVYGHEASGVVEKAGRRAAGFSEGDSVVLSYPSCGVCLPCGKGRPYDCIRFTDLFLGDRLTGGDPLSYRGRSVRAFFGQGGFATHALVHQSSAVKVERCPDLRMLGPLGCGLQTGAGSVMNFLRPAPGTSLAVFGAGSVGLAAVLAARALGCGPIVAVDRVDARLERAARFGAAFTLHTGKTADLEGSLMAVTGGLDFAFDTTGDTGLMNLAVRCLRPGGKGCGVAAAGQPAISRTDRDMGKSWDELIQGNAVSQEFIPKLIKLYCDGLFPFEEMLTYFEFDRIGEAVSQMRAARVVKPVLIM